ncbi:MAG: ATP-binding protein [Myxococcota bacterium]
MHLAHAQAARPTLSTSPSTMFAPTEATAVALELPFSAGGRPPLVGNRLWIAALLMALAITVAHYGTSMELITLHNILRRLYYLPIVMAAVGYGVKGGLLAAAGCALGYVPHAFLVDHHMVASLPHEGHNVGPHAGHVMGVPLSGDPSPTAEKVLEIVLFHGVGWVTGVLSERWARALEESQALTRRLHLALQERDRMREQLVRSEKLGALGQLSAGLAHEIRNPLSAIRGSAEVLAEDFRAGHPKAQLAGILLKELTRLDRVLTDFLQFARPPAPNTHPFALDKLIDEVATMTVARRQEAHISYRAEIATGLPPCLADPDHIRQILLNLVLNAIQAMPHGGTLTFRCHLLQPSDAPALRLEVQDTGSGIPTGELHRIFEPYFTTRAEGTGLGLSISHALAEANGAVLDVRSTEGRGSTFGLTLRCQEAA